MPSGASRPAARGRVTATLNDYRRVHGDDHPSTLTSRNNLACAYETAGT
jgi:hypothetical protein